MRRDMELVRKLLEEIANGKEGYDLIVISEKFNDPEQYEKDKKTNYHLEIMKQQRFIDYEYFSDYSGKGYFSKIKLTWDGQNFYSAIKNDTIWKNIKPYLKSKTLNTVGEVSFDMITTFVKVKAKEHGISLD